MPRTFEDRLAVREATPLLIGLVGPSGGGKTFSALRLATGIQRVSGGDIWGIDTESRRMLHYADRFAFRHLAFGAPFGSLDYLAAIQHCVAKGARNIIIDSTSHEHEGPGGVLDMHASETERLMKAWNKSADVVKMAAWIKPKAERRRLINTLLQINANFIFCFRAKEKMKIEKGKDPEARGFQPIAGEEFVFEMTLNCLLLPAANGVPIWQPEHLGEKQMIKLPEQFKGLFAKSPQLSEDLGQRLAEWAAGAAARTVDPAELLGRFESCSDPATLRSLEDDRRACWSRCAVDMKAKLKAASEAATNRIAAQQQAPAQQTPAQDDGSVPFDPPHTDEPSLFPEQGDPAKT